MSGEDGVQGEKKSLWGMVREFAIIIVIALLVSWTLKTFVIRSFHIPSASMEQTLEVGDRVMVNQLFFNEIQRGDIVVFDDPGGWLAPGISEQYKPNPVLVFLGLQPADAGTQLIKRVIGVGGDTVECCDDEGHLLVNGEPVDESAYLHPDVAPSDVPFSVEVPEGHYWVMGDNRSNSLDSRYNMDSAGGPYIPEDGIVGEVFVINWPLERLRWMGGADPAFETVPDTPAG